MSFIRALFPLRHLFCLSALLYSSVSIALPGTDMDELTQELRFLAAERDTVVTPSRIPEPLDRSIATTTVITRNQIRQMGARTLLDVLAWVPGLGVTQNTLGIRQIEVRGITNFFSGKLLMLLNGHPLDHNLLLAGNTAVYGDIPVGSIERVEVVRGAESALYGANAFTAVVNIITRSETELDGFELSTGWGSFNTRQQRVSFGRRYANGSRVALHFNRADTDGIAAHIPADSLSQQGLPSLAPGRTDLDEQRTDMEWKLGYGGFDLDGRFIHKRMGTFTGANLTLSDSSFQDYDDYFIRLSHRWQATNDLEIKTQAYRDFFSPVYSFEIGPQLREQSSLKNARLGGEIQATWHWRPTHTLMAGLSVVTESQYALDRRVGTDPERLLPITPSTLPMNRHRYGVYLQDVWDITRTVRLATGGRLDDYSDFGSSFNPRLGINWEFRPGYTARFSYGTAFRAPVFGELYIVNNPLMAGNPNLSPEQAETFEAGLMARLTPSLDIQATAYHSRIARMIRLTPDPLTRFRYLNTGSLYHEGLELEGRYQLDELGDGSFLSARHAWQHPVERGRMLADVPAHRAHLFFNWALNQNWSIFSHLLLKGATLREPGDGRRSVPGYGVLDISLNAHDLPYNGLGVSFTVFNLLDQSAVDPAPPGIPGDYPIAGRSFFGQVSINF